MRTKRIMRVNMYSLILHHNCAKFANSSDNRQALIINIIIIIRYSLILITSMEVQTEFEHLNHIAG